MAVRFAPQETMMGTSTFCSACFQQDGSVRHIDMDAACDRGWARDRSVTMDDLILCEHCLRGAAAMVGMLDEATVTTELKRLRVLNRRWEQRSKASDAYARQLEEALRDRPATVGPRLDLPGHRGRPRMEGDE